jgi:hypothetical protein
MKREYGKSGNRMEPVKASDKPEMNQKAQIERR